VSRSFGSVYTEPIGAQHRIYERMRDEPSEGAESDWHKHAERFIQKPKLHTPIPLWRRLTVSTPAAPGGTARRRQHLLPAEPRRLRLAWRYLNEAIGGLVPPVAPCVTSLAGAQTV
jgi:hypothetical protein